MHRQRREARLRLHALVLSLFVNCDSEDEINRLHESLAAGSHAFMPIGDFGFRRRFAWISDRFGVSWQLNPA